MLDREFNTMVPTQRLWSSINEAISYEKSHTSVWDKVRNSLSILLANPSLTVAASVLVVFAIFAAVWNMKPATSSIVDNSIAENHGLQPAAKQTETVDVVGGNDVIAPSTGTGSGYTIKETHLPDDKVARLARTLEYRPAAERVKAEPAVIRSVVSPSADAYLPGEETYVRTIADLKQNVDGQKDRVMDPVVPLRLRTRHGGRQRRYNKDEGRGEKTPEESGGETGSLLFVSKQDRSS